jgi:hypothetical protein
MGDPNAFRVSGAMKAERNNLFFMGFPGETRLRGAGV